MDGRTGGGDEVVHPPPVDENDPGPERPDTWVPVEDRVLGLDKRSFAPALVVVALLLVFGYLLPAVDSAVDPEDPVEAGDVIDLAGGTLVFTPAVGWNVDEGIRYEPGRKEAPASTSTVSRDGVAVSIRTGPFDGTPDELLDQINAENEDLQDSRGLGSAGARDSISVNGAEGVAETFTGLTEKGIVVALVYEVDGQQLGTEVTIRGSTEAVSRHQDEIAEMVDSIRLQEATQEVGS